MTRLGVRDQIQDDIDSFFGITPEMFFYHWDNADWQGAAFGALSGIGYAATIFLPDCVDAGFELGASAFMVYEWFSNPGFILAERIIGPIPDYAQLALSLFYMIACIAKIQQGIATELVNWAKYGQALFLPYLTIRTFMQGPRHNMFVAGFTFLKGIFNVLDASNYFIERYKIIDLILSII